MNIQRQQNYLFDGVDPLLKLSEVEMILRKSKVFRTMPTRATLISYCDSGAFEKTKFFRGQWFVYESSVLNFVEEMQTPSLKAA